MIYLDHAATSPLSAEVRAAMEPFLGAEFGNPSSRHRAGTRAAAAVDAARAAVARAVGARKAGVVFTSGGTEANNLATLGFARARARHGRHVLCGPTEHASVRESCLALANEGFEVEWMPLDASGAIDFERAAARLRADTVLVTLMLVQNEFGSIYPVRAIARAARARSPKACVHADLVQALGKLPISLGELEVDSIAISAHKIQGPKGAGALVLAGTVEPRPLVFGGGQEDGRRAGTENVAGIVGFGAACEIAERGRAAWFERAIDLRARLVARLAGIRGARVLEPGAAAPGTGGQAAVGTALAPAGTALAPAGTALAPAGTAPAPTGTALEPTDSALAAAGMTPAPGASAPACVPSILALHFPGAPAEVRMLHLEERGVVVSAGSACQSRKGEASPALQALGLSLEDARCVLRVSFGPATTAADVDALAAALADTQDKLGARGAGR